MAISAKATLAAAAVLALVPAAQAADPAIRVQPTDTVRTQITRVEWVAAGDSSPRVSVERRHGLWWVTEDADNLVVAHEDGVWSARWQPTRHSPSGTYRIRVEDDYTLVSDEFAVRPCECVIPSRLRARWRDGGFRLRVSAHYAPAGTGAFRLPAEPVRTGRPLVRVLRNGRRIGSVRLRYDGRAFRGVWPGPRGLRHSVVFELVSLADGFANS
jgi:hypothetical protein